jgi:hypothetical protein
MSFPEAEQLAEGITGPRALLARAVKAEVTALSEMLEQKGRAAC